MPEEPPWEWVAGDPVRAAQFGLATGILIGGFGALLVVCLLALAGLLTSAPSLDAASPAWTILVLAMATANFLFLYLFPRRFPIIGRLGISPVGVRIVLPLRGTTFPWPQVRDVGPDWIEVSSGTALRERYRLTANQAERLSHFLGIPRRG
jgi:hypothetical protein